MILYINERKMNTFELEKNYQMLLRKMLINVLFYNVFCLKCYFCPMYNKYLF